MGLGIGFDVVLATLSRLKYITGKRGLIWVRRITTTHILFPMTGYYSFIELFQLFPRLRMLLGVIAFVLIVYFLFDLVKGWLTGDDDEGEVDPFSWAVVLSVSWDALFSGPAKSAQAIGWSHLEVLFSFVISGLVVTMLAFAALVAAYLIREAAVALLKSYLNGMTLLHLVMMYIEFTVLAYFGVLALLRYTFASETPMLEVAVIAALVGAVLFLCAGKVLFKKTRSHVVTTLGIPEHAQPI